MEVLLTDGIHLVTLKYKTPNGGYDEVSVEVTVLLIASEATNNNPIPSLGVLFVLSIIVLVSLMKSKINYIR